MSAILFGSISTLVDSSELQRRAFNTAFSQHGLDWSWDQEEYAALLTGNGGQDRVAAYAEQRGDDVDAAAVHATKSEVFRTLLAEEAPQPRAGVVETIRAAKEAGHRLGFVTTTSADNVAAVLKVPGLSAADFDVVVDAAAVHATKSEVFRTLLAEVAPEPRAGVVETIRAAKEAGHRLGFVTTTSADNVAAVLKVPGLSAADFDVVVDADDVDEPKPAAEAYRHALAALGEHASDAVAVEDNTGGVTSARAAGLPVVAFPNTNTADHDWSEATERVDALELDDLLRNVGR